MDEMQAVHQVTAEHSNRWVFCLMIDKNVIC